MNIMLEFLDYLTNPKYRITRKKNALYLKTLMAVRQNPVRPTGCFGFTLNKPKQGE